MLANRLRLGDRPQLTTMAPPAAPRTYDDPPKRHEEAGPYDKRWGRYRVRVDSDALKKHAQVLADVMKRAHDRAT